MDWPTTFGAFLLFLYIYCQFRRNFVKNIESEIFRTRLYIYLYIRWKSHLKKKTKQILSLCWFQEKCLKLCKKSECYNPGIKKCFDWKDYSSQHKLKQMNSRPYVKDLIHLLFERGKNTMKFKTNFNDVEYTNLDFLNAGIRKKR